MSLFCVGSEATYIPHWRGEALVVVGKVSPECRLHSSGEGRSTRLGWGLARESERDHLPEITASATGRPALGRERVSHYIIFPSRLSSLRRTAQSFVFSSLDYNLVEQDGKTLYVCKVCGDSRP